MSEARTSIHRIMNEYCYRLDTGDFDGFAELFDHATWLIRGDPDGGDTGAAAVRETLQQVILYDGKPNTKHVMSNVQIDVEESSKRAEAQCYITVFQAVPPDFPLQPIFSGHYHDIFEKVDGRWRFSSREIVPDLVGDLSRHRADMA
jgi:hypothetical protein